MKKHQILAFFLMLIIALGGLTAFGWSEQSTFPNQGMRHGTIVRNYEYATDGTTSPVTLHKGSATVNIPANTLIKSGYVQVIAADPGITNISVGCNGVATNLLNGYDASSDAADAIVPMIPGSATTTALIYDSDGNGTMATNTVVTGFNDPILTSTNVPLTVTFTGTVATNLQLQVILDCYYAQ